jgi:small subunit ribosomal protein S18
MKETAEDKDTTVSHEQNEEAPLDWDALMAQFKSNDGEGLSDEFGAFDEEDLEALAQVSYDFQPDAPPKLTTAHYNALKDVNPELYAEWVSLRTVQWKLENKLSPLPSIPFKADDVDAYDNIPLWDKPTARPRKKSCHLCQVDTSENQENQITFTNLTLLHKHLNERGMIIGRRTSGLCGPHQRKVAKAIKRARIAGLLSFTSNWKIPESQLPLEITAGEQLSATSTPEFMDFSGVDLEQESRTETETY